MLKELSSLIKPNKGVITMKSWKLHLHGLVGMTILPMMTSVAMSGGECDAMVSCSQCGGSASVFVDAKATASFSAAAIVSYMDCSSLYMDSLISWTSVSSFSMRSFWVVIALIPIDIGYELRDGFGSDVRWNIDKELQLGLEINHK
jgi:hypothetical protein